MLHPGDLDAAGRRARQARQQNAAQGVAQRRTITPFQRLYDQPAIAAVLRQVLTINTRLFDFDH